MIFSVKHGWRLRGFNDSARIFKSLAWRADEGLDRLLIQLGRREPPFNLANPVRTWFDVMTSVRLGMVCKFDPELS